MPSTLSLFLPLFSFLYLGFCLTSWRLAGCCFLPPICTLYTLLGASWKTDLSGLHQETDLCGLHEQAPLPSDFWWDLANERHSKRSGDQKKVRSGCLSPPAWIPAWLPQLLPPPIPLHNSTPSLVPSDGHNLPLPLLAERW